MRPPAQRRLQTTGVRPGPRSGILLRVRNIAVLSLYRVMSPWGFAVSGIGLLAVLAALLTFSDPLGANSNANRVISIYNIHNKETVTVTYKRNGAYQPKALKKLNWVMRDWRQNESTRMDPKLIDIIWEMHTELGSRKPVHLISGYRSRKTNNGLRKTRGGQARNSRHIVGKAADIHFPDVPVRRLRYAALVKERGGVGYYPTSALPFVHVDTGRVRHWPRIGRDELALLTKGRSRHIPRGGRSVTKKDYQRARVRNTKLAQRIALFHRGRKGTKGRGRTQIASLDTASPKQWSIPTPKVAARPIKKPKRTVTAALTPAAVPKRSAPVRIDQQVKAPTAWPKARVAKPEVKASGDLFAGLDTDESTLDRSDPTRRKLPKPILPDVSSGDAPATTPPAPGRRPRSSIKVASLNPEATVRDESLDVLQPVRPEPSRPFFELSGWAKAPDYDDEHDGELSYRPFPIGPFLTSNPSIDDPVVARLVHPDLAGTRDLVGLEDDDVPLRFKPGVQFAEMLWTDIFKNDGIDAVLEGDPALGGAQRKASKQ